MHNRSVQERQALSAFVKLSAWAESAPAENGFVLLPNEASWLADYLAELTVFPNGRYDDQVDSTAQFLAWTRMPKDCGIIDYWGRIDTPKQKMVRLIAPNNPYLVAVCGWDRDYPVHRGRVEVPEALVEGLLRSGYRKDE